MAVSTVTNRVAYQGNGSSAVFSFPYRFHSQSHLGVFVYNSSVIDGSLIVPQVLNTHYTISGTANNQGIYTSGGSVVFNSSPSAQAQVVIFRSSVVTNDFALSQNGAIPSTALNNELDYLTLIAQRYQDQASRSVKMADGYPGAFDPNLPANLATSAGKRLIVNSSATGWTFDETLGSYIPNTVVVATNNSSINSLPGAGSGLILTSNGSSLPSWSAISIGSGTVSAGAITGVLGVLNGGTGTGAVHSRGAVIFSGSGGVYSDSFPQLYWDATNNFLGISNNVPDAPLTIAINSTILAPQANTLVHLIGSDQLSARLTIDSHGSSATGSAGGLIFRRTNGTGASPSAVNADMTLGFVGATGYAAAAFGTPHGISFRAAQNWNGSNNGSYIQFNVNANGASTSTTRMRLENDGALKLSAYANQGLLSAGSGGVLAQLLTTLGDLPYMGIGPTVARLPVGAAGQVLTASSASGVAWANPATGFTNPMTSGGDLIVGSGAGTAARLAVGVQGQFLSNSSSLGVGWGAGPIRANGDLIVGSGSFSSQRVAAGLAGQVLVASSAVGASWNYPQTACAATAAGSSALNGTWNSINFSTEHVDTDGAYTTPMFTVPAGKGGLYQVSATGFFSPNSSSSGTAFIRFLINSSVPLGMVTGTGVPVQTQVYGVGLSTVYPLAAGGTVILQGLQNTGALCPFDGILSIVKV